MDPSEAAQRGAEIGRKVVLYGVLAFGGLMALTMVGACAGVIVWGAFGDARVTLYNDSDAAYQVHLDGLPHQRIEGRGAHLMKIPNGDRQLRIEGPDGVFTTWDLPAANALDEQLIPLQEGTCFIQVEVSRVFYEHTLPWEDPSVDVCGWDTADARWIDTWDSFPAFHSGNDDFTIADLPRQTDGLVFMTVPVACADLPDLDAGAELKRHIGCP